MTITIPIIDNAVVLFTMSVFVVVVFIRLLRWILDILP
jgi:hypothetical protein